MADVYPSGKEKQRLQKQLQNIEFVSSEAELKKYRCDFCNKIALEKHQAECGHGFCNNCNDDVHGRPCPVRNCETNLIKCSTRNSDFEAAVYYLEVFCRNRRLGCKEKMHLINYLEHETSCPVAVEIAEASDKVITGMRAEIDDLKLMIKSLQVDMVKDEESIRMNLHGQRALGTDLQLMEGKLTGLISQKMAAESQNLVGKLDKELQRIAKEQSSIQAQVDKNFAIQQNQELGLEKKEIEKFIKDQIREECNKGMRQFTKDVTDMVNVLARKQKEELKTAILDELTGRLAITELDLEIKLKDKFDDKSNLFLRNMETKFTSMFNKETSANKIAFEAWSAKTLRDKVEILKKNLEKDFVLFLNQKFQVYKQELGDVMLEEVNDKLDECTKSLNQYIKNELSEKIALQKQFLLKKFLEEIETKSEKSKTEVLGRVETRMLTELDIQKKKIEASSLKHIQEKMQTTEKEFCEFFSAQINEKMETQMQELYEMLSQEFNNEITVLQGHVQEQYEIGLQLGESIESLDAKYLGKPEFLLEKYSTTFVWPLTDFLQKAKMLQDGSLTEIESDGFMVRDCKMLMKAKLTWRNSNIILMLAFMPTEELRPVYHHRRRIALLDQRAAISDRKHRVRVEEPHFRSKLAQEWMDEFCTCGVQLFPSLEELARSPFVKNGTALVQICIEPLAILYKSMVSNNGVLVWKIENFSRLIPDEKCGVIEYVRSPCFYSGPNGYRMQVAAYFATPFVTFYLHFLSGQFDEFLPDTFAHRTTFMILDQSDLTEKKHLTKSPKSSSDRPVCVDFVSKFAHRSAILGHAVPHSVADPPSPIYLKNDAVLIKVLVQSGSDDSEDEE